MAARLCDPLELTRAGAHHGAMTAEPAARCYRCLERYPEALLRVVPATCGCEHAYCEACLAAPRFGSWLVFVGSVCLRAVRAAA